MIQEAGASTPEWLKQKHIKAIKDKYKKEQEKEQQEKKPEEGSTEEKKEEPTSFINDAGLLVIPPKAKVFGY